MKRLACGLAVWLARRTPRTRTTVATGLAILTAAELYTPLSLRDAPPVTQVERYLAGARRGPVLELPFFYEFLAPFGDCRAIARDLRGLPFFRGRRVPSIRVKVDEDSNHTAQVRYVAM